MATPALMSAQSEILMATFSHVHREKLKEKEEALNRILEEIKVLEGNFDKVNNCL